MTGTLYIVPTPIGNLGDITERAKETLSEVDFVACEDTRVGGKLLYLLGIKKELVQHHEHNKIKSAKYVALRIKNGESCALISDAGTPAVSDPGEELVRCCIEEGVKVVPLTGPCAAVCALSASGLPSRRFIFEGFLPEKSKERKELLAEIATQRRTVVFYCTPHDIKQDLSSMLDALGNRKVFIARELTKLNEQLVSAKLSVAIEMLENGEIPLKGEFVVILEGASQADISAGEFWAEMSVEQHVSHYLALGFSKMDAVKKVAKDRGLPKSVIYDEVK